MKLKNPLTYIWSILFPKKDHHLQTRLKIIAVINKIKWAVDSPVASAITDAIPGRTDDAILEWIRKALPVVLKSFALAENGLNAHIAVKQAIGTLKTIEPSDRSGVYQVLAGRLYECFTGLPIETATEEIQRTYSETK